MVLFMSFFTFPICDYHGFACASVFRFEIGFYAEALHGAIEIHRLDAIVDLQHLIEPYFMGQRHIDAGGILFICQVGFRSTFPFPPKFSNRDRRLMLALPKINAAGFVFAYPVCFVLIHTDIDRIRFADLFRDFFRRD